MSDALCGPSNAVQNLAKHSSVDRTLQQDRLVSRQSPSQGFRSHTPNAASLDPEFDAFQAGHAPTLAGPSWAGPSLPAFPQQHAQTAPSGLANGWTQDFQNLNISPQPQLQHTPQAWQSQFNRGSPSPASFQSATPQMQPQPTRFYTPPIFNRMQSGIQQPHHAFQAQQAPQAQQQLPQDHFDEAAFEAAFDAAMADASVDQGAVVEEHAPEQDNFQVDLYPHLPLYRLVLANALVENDDASLHKAARVIDSLLKHPTPVMDPLQAMLFRPLISALNDPKRTIFAQRYGFEPALTTLSEELARDSERSKLHIDLTADQLLASYADVIWQRHESNHLQPRSEPRSRDNAYWLDQFYQDDSWAHSGNITLDSARLLSQGFNNQIISNPHSQALRRVLELEYDAYTKRPVVANMSLQTPTSMQEREASLFNMMDHVLSAPETVEALESTSTQKDAADQPVYSDVMADLETRNNFAREEANLRLQAVEQQNLARLRADLAAQAYEQDIARSGNTTDMQMDTTDMSMDATDMRTDQQTLSEKEELDRQHDDELAQTAANLLDRVSDNQTTKFKNSAFLGLMRQLADREVRVEGDKMVPTNGTTKVANNDGGASDGQEVIDLLKQPGEIISNQDPDFMMTSPFASANDY